VESAVEEMSTAMDADIVDRQKMLFMLSWAARVCWL
jgi:hypothetical protein